MTTFHIGPNVTAKGRPIVLSGDQLSSFFNSEVTSQWIVVIPADQSCEDDFRKIEEALVMQQSIYVLLAIFQTLFSDFLCHLIPLLQLQELQPHASDTGLLVWPVGGQVATIFTPELTKLKEDVSSTNEDLVERKKAARWSRLEACKTERC